MAVVERVRPGNRFERPEKNWRKPILLGIAGSFSRFFRGIHTGESGLRGRRFPFESSAGPCGRIRRWPVLQSGPAVPTVPAFFW